MVKIYIRRALIFTLVSVVLFSGGFVVWANQTPEPMPEAIAALSSDAAVMVTTEPWLLFEPAAGPGEVGLIFYPGGKVDPRSYAPAANQIAAAGYRVVILPMPLNLAIFAPDRAQEVIRGLSRCLKVGASRSFPRRGDGRSFRVREPWGAGRVGILGGLSRRDRTIWPDRISRSCRFMARWMAWLPWRK